MWLSSLIMYAMACTIPHHYPPATPILVIRWAQNHQPLTSILVIWSTPNHLAAPQPFFLLNPHPLSQSWPLAVWALALKSRFMFAANTLSATAPTSTTEGSCTIWTSSTATPSPSSKEVRVFFFFSHHSFQSDIASPGRSITLSHLNNDPLQKLICPICKLTFFHKTAASKYVREAHLKADNNHPSKCHPHLVTLMDPIGWEEEVEPTRDNLPTVTSCPHCLRSVANPVVITQTPLLAEASSCSSLGKGNPPCGYGDNVLSFLPKSGLSDRAKTMANPLNPAPVVTTVGQGTFPLTARGHHGLGWTLNLLIVFHVKVTFFLDPTFCWSFLFGKTLTVAKISSSHPM